MKFQRAPSNQPWAKYINPLLDWAEKQNISVGPGLVMHQGGNGIALGLASRATESTTYFFAKITASGKEWADLPVMSPQVSRWLYSWVEVRKKLTHYQAGAWETVSDGRSGSHRFDGEDPAHNFIEHINRDSLSNHTLGNGVLVDPDGYIQGTGLELEPVPNEVLVVMYEVTLTGGGKEYWFSYENSMDGLCSPPL